MMRITHLILVLAACQSPSLPVVSAAPSIDAPLAGLNGEQLRLFNEGENLTSVPFSASQGLGPTYVRTSCTSCHADDQGMRGPGFVDRLAATDPSLLPYGDTIRPFVAGGATLPVTAPDHSGVTVHRRIPPPFFARGLLEAISQDAILAQAQAQAASPDAIQGVVPWVIDPRTGEEGLGRFGFKSRAVDLDVFVASALQGDMSITNPIFPTEPPSPDGHKDDERPGVDVGSDVVNTLAVYVRFIAPPVRPELDPEGADIFASTGCAICHKPSLKLDPSHPFTALTPYSGAYTDMLLHDMGDALADGVPEGADTAGRLWRTTPLIGVASQPLFLHDGRAATIESAIIAHKSEGSEASAIVDAFQQLSASDRESLIRFVSTL